MKRRVSHGDRQGANGQLLAGGDPKEIFARDGLLDDLKKALSERILNAELKGSIAKHSKPDACFTADKLHNIKPDAPDPPFNRAAQSSNLSDGGQ